jgi:Histidine kinase-, DNA gyrase B-, and HSP90-like ATPase
MSQSKVLLPDPSRLIEGLRDTGYDFNTALADIIDNSIDAKATKVRIWIRMDVDGDVTVSVADDGHGMDEDALLNAMTYGAKSKKDKSCLGKFGLGLKTASTAFSRRLSVITRAKKNGPFLKATWDLDHVAGKKQWEVLLDKPSKEETGLLDEAASAGAPGTLVLWEKIDRLLKDYEKPNGAAARTALKKVAEEFQDHASMIYQRFLDPDDKRARTIEMVVNNTTLKAWDPFCKQNPNAEAVAVKTQPVELSDGGTAEFDIKAVVLPRREEFESPAAAKAARLENQTQGIYVYRENRLIHPADWLGMFSKEPHFSLLRVEFSFDHRLDDAFQVDIKKSRIMLKDELYNWVFSQFLPGPRRAAEERYRKGEKKKAQEKAKDAHASSNAAISAKEDDLKLAEITVKDAAKGDVEITNKQGTFRIKMPVSTALNKGEVSVQPVPSIDDGLLWEPCLIDGHHGVRINTGHAYYHKVYVPNLTSGVTIQGMDSLLWALSEAEIGATTDTTRKHFKELRFEIARLLRNLVEDLPDPDMTTEGKDVTNA